MKEIKQPNIVNFLDSYLVGESELWVRGEEGKSIQTKYMYMYMYMANVCNLKVECIIVTHVHTCTMLV